MLAAISAAKGMRHAVISSGFRNAPLIIAFDAQNEIECLSIVDERSANVSPSVLHNKRICLWD